MKIKYIKDIKDTVEEYKQHKGAKKMKDRIEEIIYNWVLKNYGESEVENPSWNIKLLADYLKPYINTMERKEKIQRRERAVIEEVVNYFDYHNKNMNKSQDWQIYRLKQLLKGNIIKGE